MSAPRLSVVIPVLDEQESLRSVDGELRGALAEWGQPCEIVYVDDGSRDGSRRILRDLVENGGRHGPRTRAIFLQRNYGQTAALAAGFDAAEGSVVVAMDADGQFDPRDIPRLAALLDGGFEVASGWRRKRRDGAVLRRWPSAVANWAVGKLAGLSLHDFGCTFKAYDAATLRRVRLYGDMHRFLPAHLHRVGARVGELEVSHRPRLAGRSKYGIGRTARVLADLVLIRFLARYFTRPMHFFGAAGLWFLALALLVGGLMVVIKYGGLSWIGSDYRADFVQTPLPALAVSLGIAAVLSFFFGILAEILIRLVHESRDLPAYSIDERLDSAAASAERPTASPVLGPTGS